MTKTNGEVGVYLAYTSNHSLSLKKEKAKTQARQDSGSRNWINDHWGMSLTPLLHTMCKQANLMEAFLSIKVPFCHLTDSCLCKKIDQYRELYACSCRQKAKCTNSICGISMFKITRKWRKEEISNYGNHLELQLSFQQLKFHQLPKTV